MLCYYLGEKKRNWLDSTCEQNAMKKQNLESSKCLRWNNKYHLCMRKKKKKKKKKNIRIQMLSSNTKILKQRQKCKQNKKNAWIFAYNVQYIYNVPVDHSNAVEVARTRHSHTKQRSNSQNKSKKPKTVVE